MELRKKSILCSLETIMIFFASLLAIAILPSILLKYFYAGQQLFEQPKLLEYIPIVSFAIAATYFIKALIGNFTRERQISKLMIELETTADCCGNQNNDDEDWNEDLQELEELLEEVEEKTPKKKISKTKAVARKGKTARSKK